MSREGEEGCVSQGRRRQNENEQQIGIEQQIELDRRVDSNIPWF